MRITTNSSRMLFNATMSLLMSYLSVGKVDDLFGLYKNQGKIEMQVWIYIHRSCD